MSNDNKPRVVLVGYGKFGKEYYKELNILEREGRLVLHCVYTKTGITSEQLRHDVRSISELEKGVDKDLIDGLIIATPPNTHRDFVKKYSSQFNLLVEKPIGLSALDVEEYRSNSSKMIIPAHNYRFHPAVIFSRDKLKKLSSKVLEVSSTFVSSKSKTEIDPGLEMLHALDIIQFITNRPIISSHRYTIDNVAHVDCEHDTFVSKSKLGFSNYDERSIRISLERFEIKIDLIGNIVEIHDSERDLLEKEIFKKVHTLKTQISAFCESIQNGKQHPQFASLDEAKEVISAICTSSQPSIKPRIAVIGGGFFGCQCAIELSKIAEVSLFERNDELLTEASLKNQWRHHSGFHYPLSFETVSEIKYCKSLFESEYGDAIVHNVPSYYMVSKYGVEIPAERYLASCNYNKLNYKVVPTLDCVNNKAVSITMLTDEGIYDIAILRQLVLERLKSTEVKIQLGNSVESGRLENGKKILSIKTDNSSRDEQYDVVINCSYADFGRMSSLFKVLPKKVRLECVEMLEIELNIPPICLTFIDAPFLSLTYMLKENRFFLTHRDHSVLQRAYEPHHSKFEFDQMKSNSDNILKDSIRYMPFLENAKVARSWFTFKARSAYEKEFWEVPTVLKDHGIGYWSLLGGKLLTAPSNAKELSKQVALYLGG